MSYVKSVKTNSFSSIQSLEDLTIQKQEVPVTEKEENIVTHSDESVTPQTEFILKTNKTDDNLDEKSNTILKAIIFPVNVIKKFVKKNNESINAFLKWIFAIGVTVYMIVACIRHFHRAIPLLVIWSVVVAYLIYGYIYNRYEEEFDSFCVPLQTVVSSNMYWIKWVVLVFVIVGLAVWIALVTASTPQNLVSLLGYFVFLFFLFLTSKYPLKVKWRPVLWGLALQVSFGYFILRTDAGFALFSWIGGITRTFINFVEAGVLLVYGENYNDHYVAFVVLSIVIYFGSFISIMYYLGVMQWVIRKIGWLMQKTLQTSATESLVAAGNIFVGLAESPLLIRPYINDLTSSELHAIMTAGFGSIAGSVLGAYLGFGIQPIFVITACFMAAPCSLAVSKLFYPETQKSSITDGENLIFEDSTSTNIIQAASSGASQAITLVLNILANLIAFFSILAAINALLSWFGGLMDFPQLSFELICSYVFVPITVLLGIEWTYCFKASELLGVKIFLNEFIAYQSLAEMLRLRDSGTVPLFNPDTGDVNWVDERTEAVVTYALCSFANFASMGIMLGGLGALAPKRFTEISKLILRTLIGGVFVSLLNACVAGFLYVPRPIVCDNMLSTTNWTYTEPSRLFACCNGALKLELSNSTRTCNCCAYAWTQTNFSLDCTQTNC